MFDLPIHPFIVHIPIGLSVLMPLFVFVLMVLISKGFLPANAWTLLIMVQLIVVIACIAARFSGESESSYVANYVAEELIERHEELANVFFASQIGLFIVAILGAVAPLRTLLATRLFFGFASCAVAALGIWAGSAGTDLVYKYGGARAFGGGQSEEYLDEQMLDDDELTQNDNANTSSEQTY